MNLAIEKLHDPTKAELRLVATRARRRRQRLNCHDDEPDCDAESFDRLKAQITLACIAEVAGEGLVHARFVNGELFHSFIDDDMLQPVMKRWRFSRKRRRDPDFEARLLLDLASGYVLTAFGWEGTAACKLAIMRELQAERGCPFCTKFLPEEETNEEGQQC